MELAPSSRSVHVAVYHSVERRNACYGEQCNHFEKLNIDLITALLIVDWENIFNSRSLGPTTSSIFITTIALVPKQKTHLTVLEAINASGGLTPEADSRNITLTRDGKNYKIKLLALYEGGDALNVPDRQLNKIFVFGETSASTAGSDSSVIPGGSTSTRARSLYMRKGRMTVAEALSDAGGINQDFADAARIFIFRGGLGKQKIFHLDAKSSDTLLLADRFPWSSGVFRAMAAWLKNLLNYMEKF